MSKKRRLTFRCANCGRNFPFQKEITEEQQWIFSCPYCGTELSVQLESFKQENKTILRGEGGAEESPEWDYDFPAVIPTQIREQ